MSAELLFQISNVAALPAWLLLAVFPRKEWVLRFTTIVVSGLLFGGLYATVLVLVQTGTIGGDTQGGFGSLAEVYALFSEPYALLVGWVHYLAFDLLAGVWQIKEAQRVGIPHLAILPTLFLTLMFGPAGFLLFLLMRLIWKRVFWHAGPFESEGAA